MSDTAAPPAPAESKTDHAAPAKPAGGRPGHAARELPEPTIKLKQGWHCTHLFYRVDPSALNALSTSDRIRGRQELIEALDPAAGHAPERMQTWIVSGHKADLAVVMMDPDPLKIDAVQQAVRATALGPALVPTYSYVSITEISEYVHSVEEFAEKLKAEGMDESDPAYQSRVRGYGQRLPMMNAQRLTPTIPPMPVACFYPMNKIRDPHANWYTLPFEDRDRMMAEHAKSGIQFAGRVSQTITASTGFDDWEWGVTLWSRTPDDIKKIVYTMRFDEASAKYAEFGPFYIGYVKEIADVVEHLKL
ncbi:MAG: hydrogen peroxide-dependent heme synthase [Planctomycetota bacterium]